MKINTVLLKADTDLLGRIFREYVANLEAEKTQAEKSKGRAFPWYDSEIEKARALWKKILYNE